MSDVTAAQRPIERARALFAAEELPFPPLPADMAEGLREVAPNVFSTRPADTSPYNLEVFSNEVQRAPGVANYGLVGFDGHGINSWAAHYYLVDDALALFIQMPWGGAYVEPDEARRRIRAAFAWAEQVQAQVKRLRKDGLIPAGWRLLVVVSRFARPGWAWIAPKHGPGAVEWHGGEELRTAVDKSLADLAAGRAKLG
jgi:hypothetical protein